MMHHPIDIKSRDNTERPTPPGGGGSGRWAVIAMVVVLAAVLTVVLSGGDAQQPQDPVPNEAPFIPGE